MMSLESHWRPTRPTRPLRVAEVGPCPGAFMKAHIVGGGFGGLAAAALLIRNAGMSGPDITIYEAEDTLGGGFFLTGDAKSGYNLPGSIFDKEYRCALTLLAEIPTQ